MLDFGQFFPVKIVGVVLARARNWWNLAATAVAVRRVWRRTSISMDGIGGGFDPDVGPNWGIGEKGFLILALQFYPLVIHFVS